MRTWNMGIGMVVIVSADNCAAVCQGLKVRSAASACSTHAALRGLSKVVMATTSTGTHAESGQAPATRPCIPVAIEDRLPGRPDRACRRTCAGTVPELRLVRSISVPVVCCAQEMGEDALIIGKVVPVADGERDFQRLVKIDNVPVY